MNRTPLIYSVAASSGLLAAVLLGPWIPGWGPALAWPVTLTFFGVAAVYSRADPLARNVLRGAVALGAGFVAATIVVTASHVSTSLGAVEAVFVLGAEGGDEAWQTLSLMWATMAAGPVLGGVALFATRND